jgi:hypothetical protein
VVSERLGWAPLPDARDERTQHRVLDQRVSAVVAPGPGGRWGTWVSVDGTLRQGPLAADQAAARSTADLLARAALAELERLAPERADRLVADTAAQPEVWDRRVLVAACGHRLTDADRADLTTTSDPSRLVDLMSAAGVLAPATMLRVLHAEAVPADAAAVLVPAIGMAVPDAIRVLHEVWGVDRLDAAAHLGSTAEELRAAGCSAVELLAAAPRETLRSLDTRESTWVRVGPSLLEAGYTEAEAVAHLAAHAPTPEAFAAGVTAVVDDPTAACAFAARRAGAEDLAVLTERYGLTPGEAAAAFAAAGVRSDVAVEAVHLRCDHDLDATFEVASHVLGVGGDVVTAILTRNVAEVVALDAQHPSIDDIGEMVEVATGAGIDS